MSKELIVAGSIVAACIGLSVVAFVNPGAKPVEPTPEPTLTQSDPTPVPDRWSTGTESSTSGSDPFTAFPSPPVAPERDPFALPTPPVAPVEIEPVAAPTPPPAATTERSHVVAKGDTLGDISRQYYGTTRHWKKIQDANQVDPNGLLVGQKLVIPVVASEPTVTSASTTTDANSAGLYVVKKGDSYYRIAERELGDPSRSREIERLNGVAPEDLRVGQKLKLPSRAATASPTPTGGSTTSAPTVPDGARLHSVRKDEYLIDISEKYYGTTSRWKVIADANPGVNPNRLVVGQKLVIPDAPGSSSSTAGGGSSSTTVVAGGEYVIKSGDTLERIAQRTLGDGSKWRDIAKLNPGLDPTRLMVGQKITLPKEAQQPTPAPAPTRPQSTPSPTFPTPAPAPTFPDPNPAPAPVFPAPSSDTPFPAPAPVAEDPWNLPPAPAPADAQPAPVMDDPWADFPGSTR